MEIITYSIPGSTKYLYLCPLGDIQYLGKKGPTAGEQLKYHIDDCLELEGRPKTEVRFVGVGDYGDIFSPSNRKALQGKGLYDTALKMNADAAHSLMSELHEEYLKPTTGKWIGLLHGHHWYAPEGGYENGDMSTDQVLARLLKAKFIGTEVICKIPNANMTFYAHHGVGSGRTAGSGINTIANMEKGWGEQIDVYFMGHNTKEGAVRETRPYVVWQKDPYLRHHDVLMVNCGGFSKSHVVGAKLGSMPYGGYAEHGMMPPSPLSAPMVSVRIGAPYKPIRAII